MTTQAISDRDQSILLGTVTTSDIRPRYEGANICTWIGFKHVNYLVEEAVLEHFRRAGFGARALYEDHGLCLDLVEIDTRILHAFHVDDTATADVEPTGIVDSSELGFFVVLHVSRDGNDVKAVTSKVRVALVADRRQEAAAPIESPLAGAIVERLERGPRRIEACQTAPSRVESGGAADLVLDHLTRDANAFGWKWRIPYFYCHFTETVQMSGYLRLMEEVVDLFLAERAVSIKTLLDEHNWIPVVPHSAVSMHVDAFMEEEMYVIFTVESVFKDFTYTARMDCWVRRGDELVRTASGRIIHGYAVIDNRRDWRLVNFDERLRGALLGTGGRPDTTASPTGREASWNGS